MSELLKEIKPKFIHLGDKDYEFSPINWNVLSGIEREFEGGVAGLIKQVDSHPVTTLITLLYVFLKDRPLTKEQIGALVYKDNQAYVMDTMTEIIKDLIRSGSK